MAKKQSKKPSRPSAARSVLKMSATRARAFFLKPKNYFSLNLPPYFNFKPVLTAVAKRLAAQAGALDMKDAGKHGGVNHTLYSNKDGRYAWRPFQLIHPVLYVALVNEVTKPEAWTFLQERFRVFAHNPNIECMSIPRASRTKRSDQAAQVLQWWTGVEQKSIEFALDYEYVLQTDVTDCYASIYTHSIAWALHDKSVAKANHGDTLLGNRIDKMIRNAQLQQTNGIPQGSVLMDFIAEMMLGYADVQLTQRLGASDISDYHILRYRDDYRIFVNDTHTGDMILKALNEVLMGLGLKANAQKTTEAQPVIASAVKPDKRAWQAANRYARNLQKHLLVIHTHCLKFPNAGSLVTALVEFSRRLSRSGTVQNPVPMISMVIDIGVRCPRCFPVCAAIVSKLLVSLPSEKERFAVMDRIQRRVAQVPNNGHFEVWLQRISHPIGRQVKYVEPLCRIIDAEDIELWNSEWIADKKLRYVMAETSVVDRKRLKKISPVIGKLEFDPFAYPNS